MTSSHKNTSKKDSIKYTDGSSICDKIKTHFESLSLKKKYLIQDDFQEGTYRIRKPGIYVLKEDIVFDPNPDLDYRPNNDKKYGGFEYSLDFFAGISVECPDVIIDLNSKTFRQSQAHALQQRFFSLIELANQPFIHRQGPGYFGKDLNAANYCWIKNGKLGLSSHHSIHGNGAKNILIENVEMFNFEVAGIAINGGKYLCVHDCEIGPNRTDVPVIGNYSALRFLIPYYQMAINMLIKRDLDVTSLQFVLDSLKALSQSILDEVLLTGKTTNPIFNNPSGLPDGGVYGILFHPIGIAVNDFIEEDFSGCLSKHISVSNVSIHGLSANVIEVVGLSANQEGNGIAVDPSGSVFPILKVTEDGIYNGNILSNAQILLGKTALQYDLSLGKLNFTQELVNWATSASETDPINISTLFDTGYKYKCNTDCMFHVPKGIIGLRFDGVSDVYVNNIKIRFLKNIGLMGNEVCDGNYEYSHDSQVRKGYRGANTFGVTLCYGHKVIFNNIFMNSIRSINGSTFGFSIMNQSNLMKFDDIIINNISSGYKYENGIWYCQDTDGNDTESKMSYPNLCQIAAGISIEDDNCKKYKIGKYIATKLSAPCLGARFIHMADQTPQDSTDSEIIDNDYPFF